MKECLFKPCCAAVDRFQHLCCYCCPGFGLARLLVFDTLFPLS